VLSVEYFEACSGSLFDRTLNLPTGRQALKTQYSMFNVQFSMLKEMCPSHPSTVNRQPSTVNCKLQTFF